MHWSCHHARQTYEHQPKLLTIVVPVLHILHLRLNYLVSYEEENIGHPCVQNSNPKLNWDQLQFD